MNRQHKWANGDGNLIYPGPESPLSSIRLENIRDGLEDYEYLRLLGEKVERVSKLPATAARRAFLDQPGRCWPCRTQSCAAWWSTRSSRMPSRIGGRRLRI